MRILKINLFILCCWVSGCASPALQTKHNKPISTKRLAGRVQSVNLENRFILIRRYGRWYVGDDDIVESQGEGRTSNLLPTGEKLGEHIAADIRSGEVKVGDAVYVRSIIVKEKKDDEFPEIKKQ